MSFLKVVGSSGKVLPHKSGSITAHSAERERSASVYLFYIHKPLLTLPFYVYMLLVLITIQIKVTSFIGNFSDGMEFELGKGGREFGEGKGTPCGRTIFMNFA